MMELYHQALQLPVKWHHDHHSGSIISRIRKSVRSTQSFFPKRVYVFFYSLVKFIVSFYSDDGLLFYLELSDWSLQSSRYNHI